MSELIYGFGYFWPISGLVLDELMAKTEVERKCTDLPRWCPEQRELLKISNISVQEI